MARLVVVGSGTVVPEGDRGGSCYYLELEDARVLMDCGPGAVQSLARWGLPWPELTHLILTHFHADHVGAVPGLLFSLKHGIRPARTAPLDVWGPPGTVALFQGLAGVLGDFVLDPGFPVRVRDLPRGGETGLGAGAVLRTHPTPHTEESQALRLEGEGVAVGYTGDSGPSEALGAFFRGVDLLLAECSLLDEEVGDNHLSPGRVARLAVVARPRRLLLTHVYPHLREGYDVVRLVREAGYREGEVELAFDGLSHRLPED